MGYRFRSRLEARWAVFFGALGIDWEYEKEGYDLGNTGFYLPDFWLPQVKMWAEVKPEKLNDTERRKCEVLAQETDHPCLMLIGVPENKAYEAISYAVTDGGWPGEYEGVSDGWALTSYVLTAHRLREGRFYWCLSISDTDHFSDTENAVNAARSARFEHGEQP